VDDVATGIGLNQTSRGGTESASHVGDEESTLGLGSDLISDGGKQSTVAVRELGVVRIASVEVERSVLGLQERQETTTDEQLAIEGCSQVVRGVATAGHIRNGDEAAKGILEYG
jgi:hypothetical protein